MFLALVLKWGGSANLKICWTASCFLKTVYTDVSCTKKFRENGTTATTSTVQKNRVLAVIIRKLTNVFKLLLRAVGAKIATRLIAHKCCPWWRVLRFTVCLANESVKVLRTDLAWITFKRLELTKSTVITIIINHTADTANKFQKLAYICPKYAFQF